MYPYLIAIVLIAADQIIKQIIVNTISKIDTFALIPGFLNFTYSENMGVAFGMFSGGRILFILLTLLIIGAVCWLIENSKYNEPWFTMLLGIIMGGAVGNLIDRIRLGYVVDYIHFSFFPYIFNFADSCVVVGAILVGISVLFFNSGEALLGEEKR